MNVIKARLLPAVWGSLLAGLAILPVNYIHDLTVAVLLFAISTFMVSARVGVLWALVGDISPKEVVGTFGGIQNFANFIGAALAPVGTGYLLSVTNNNYNIVFIVGGVFCILGSLCYAMINSPIKTEEIVIV
jgi:MFS family permease